MVGAIGSISSSIYQYQLTMPDVTQASQAASFEELVSNGKIENPSADSQSASVSAASAGGTSSSSSSSSSANSEMDLNNDGQVTSDEVIRYMQMQMLDKMSEQMSSEDGAFEMGQQGTEKSNGIEKFQAKQAAGAYQANQDSLIDMITTSFMA